MEWCEALLVYLVDVSSALNELIHHHVLPVVAGHMEGRVAIRVGLIDLDTQGKQGVVITRLFPRQNKEVLYCHSFHTQYKKLANYYPKQMKCTRRGYVVISISSSSVFSLSKIRLWVELTSTPKSRRYLTTLIIPLEAAACKGV